MSINSQASTGVSKPTNSSSTATILFTLFTAMTAVGLYAAFTILIQGQSTLAATNFVPWNIFVTAYLYFVVIGSGICIISAVGHLSGLDYFKPIGFRATALAIIFLVVGMLGILLDIGRPLMMVNMLLSPNFSSPMFWMGAAYSLYLVFLALELLATKDGNQSAISRYSTLALITAFVALGTLGGLFGMLYAKPMWYGAFSPIYMVITALVSGLAALSIFTAISYHSRGLTMNHDMEKTLSSLGKVQFIALLSLAFLVFWRTASYFYGGNTDQLLAINSQFWTAEVLIGLIIPLAILAFPAMRTKGGIVTASLLILVGMFVARNNFVIGGQLARPYHQPLATYSANSLEIMYVIGLLGLAGFLYSIVNKYLDFEKYESQYKENH